MRSPRISDTFRFKKSPPSRSGMCSFMKETGCEENRLLTRWLPVVILMSNRIHRVPRNS